MSAGNGIKRFSIQLRRKTSQLIKLIRSLTNIGDATNGYWHLKKIADTNTNVYFTSTNPQNGKKVFLLTENKDKNLGQTGCIDCPKLKKNRFRVIENEEGKFAFHTDDKMYLHK